MKLKNHDNTKNPLFVGIFLIINIVFSQNELVLFLIFLFIYGKENDQENIRKNLQFIAVPSQNIYFSIKNEIIILLMETKKEPSKNQHKKSVKNLDSSC